MRGITENAVNDIYNHIQNVCPSMKKKTNDQRFHSETRMSENRVVLLSHPQTPEREFVIKLSALEIYNEVVKDLLNPDSGPLRLLDDPEVFFFSC